MPTVFRAVIRWCFLTVFWSAFIVVFVWVVAGVCHLDFWMPGLLAAILGLLLAVVILLGVFRPSSRRVTIMVLGVVGLGLMLIFQSRTPRTDGDWMTGHERQATVSVSADHRFVQIQGIRDFSYPVDASVEKRWLDKTLDLELLDSVWLGVDRFSQFESIAHTFISFGFLAQANDQPPEFIAFSVEARRQKDARIYSPVRGIFNHYELLYVVATERDMLSQRSAGATHPIQLYPLRAQTSRMRKMFLDIIRRIDELNARPEFYHTVRSNCTNNIVVHANHAGAPSERINLWQRAIIFPGYSDWLAFKHGVIDTELSLDEAREAFRVDQRAVTWDGQSDFSEHIRKK